MWRISRINEFKEEYPEQEHLKVGYFEEMKQGQEDVEALLSRKVLTSTMLEKHEKVATPPKEIERTSQISSDKSGHQAEDLDTSDDERRIKNTVFICLNKNIMYITSVNTLHHWTIFLCLK